MLKNQKGITLVALVITIIVLLILAGVSISLVIGNNGVLRQASNAVTQTKDAEVKQAIQLAIQSVETTYYAEMAKNGTADRKAIYNSDLATELENQGYSDVSVSAFTDPADGSTGSPSTVIFKINEAKYSTTVTVTSWDTGVYTLGDPTPVPVTE